MASFCVIFASCISASRVQHISDLHSKFTLRLHHVWKYDKHPISDRRFDVCHTSTHFVVLVRI